MEKGIASLQGGESSQAAEVITVVIADDHRIVRDGLKLILDEQLDIDVVAEGGDVDVAATHVVDHRPSILLLDLNMPGGSSIDLIPTIRELSADTRTIVVSMQTDPDLAHQALAAGARGYVVKRTAAAELVEAIRTVLAGEVYVSGVLRETGLSAT
jgi:two-component system, NarL family, response regulator NreC